jgi:hypothetical protein
LRFAALGVLTKTPALLVKSPSCAKAAHASDATRTSAAK